MLRQGHVHAHTPVWTAGMSGWAPLGSTLDPGAPLLLPLAGPLPRRAAGLPLILSLSAGAVVLLGLIVGVAILLARNTSGPNAGWPGGPGSASGNPFLGGA